MSIFKTQKERIVIHVGAPKTGTTYIQKSLMQDLRYLRKSSIFMPMDPRIEGIAGNAKLLALSLRGRCNKTFQRRFPAINLEEIDPKDALNVLMKDWKRSKETLLLSAEHFQPQDAKELRQLIPNNIETTVLLFIRRQDEWIQSWFNQLSKSGSISMTPEDFTDTICKKKSDLIGSCDWLENYISWKEQLGDCRVRFFEEARANILSTFLQAADFPELPKIKPRKREQVSSNGHQLAYLMEIRPDVSDNEFKVHRKASYLAANDLPELEKVSFLSPDCRQYLRKTFDKSNRALLSHLGRPQQDTILDIPESSPSYVELNAFRNSSSYRTFRSLIQKYITERRLYEKYQLPPQDRTS